MIDLANLGETDITGTLPIELLKSLDGVEWQPSPPGYYSFWWDHDHSVLASSSWCDFGFYAPGDTRWVRMGTLNYPIGIGGTSHLSGIAMMLSEGFNVWHSPPESNWRSPVKFCHCAFCGQLASGDISIQKSWMGLKQVEMWQCACCKKTKGNISRGLSFAKAIPSGRSLSAAES